MWGFIIFMLSSAKPFCKIVFLHDLLCVLPGVPNVNGQTSVNVDV